MKVYTEGNFDKEVIQETGVVVVDFWASWCMPCRALGPVFEKLAEANPQILFGKVDVENNGKLALQYEVSSIPVVVVFKDGKVVKRMVGIQKQNVYQAAIDKLTA